MKRCGQGQNIYQLEVSELCARIDVCDIVTKCAEQTYPLQGDDMQIPTCVRAQFSTPHSRFLNLSFELHYLQLLTLYYTLITLM